MSARSVEDLANIAQGADQEGLNELKDLFEQAKKKKSFVHDRKKKSSLW
jgi:hypothetical protein